MIEEEDLSRRLQALEKLAGRIDGGHWTYLPGTSSVDGTNGHTICDCHQDGLGRSGTPGDLEKLHARYIAAACPETVLALIGRLRAAEKRIATMSDCQRSTDRRPEPGTNRASRIAPLLMSRLPRDVLRDARKLDLFRPATIRTKAPPEHSEEETKRLKQLQCDSAKALGKGLAEPDHVGVTDAGLTFVMWKGHVPMMAMQAGQDDHRFATSNTLDNEAWEYL